uniref:Uncharacterized protein n=1 Tax=Brassica campestris TaxID=3711 RepID=M4CFX5_BRACM
MARSRKRIRNMVAGPYNAATLFSRPDPSAYSSGTASTQEHVPESQSQGRSLQTTLAPYVPPAPYEPAPYYPQYEPPYQRQYDQLPPHNPDQQPPPAPDDAAPAPTAVHPDLMGAIACSDRPFQTSSRQTSGTRIRTCLLHCTTFGGLVSSDLRKIYNDVEALIQEVQTQMLQQNPEGEPVLLSTVEQNKKFEQVVSKKKDVPRARAEYAARMHEDSQLQTY